MLNVDALIICIMLTITSIYRVDAFNIFLGQICALIMNLTWRIRTIWFCCHYFISSEKWTVMHDWSIIIGMWWNLAATLTTRCKLGWPSSCWIPSGYLIVPYFVIIYGYILIPVRTSLLVVKTWSRKDLHATISVNESKKVTKSFTTACVVKFNKAIT